MPRNAPRRKNNKTPLPASDNSIQVSFFMDRDHHTQLRTHCAAIDRDLSDFFREAAAKFCKQETIHASTQDR